MPTYSYILSMRIIVCYVVSYEHAVALYTHPVIFEEYFLIKTSGSESRGQEEAASTHIFKPMRPLQ